MKTLYSILILFAVTLALPASAAEGWLTEIAEAKTKAQKENKDILIKFTGSDWCPPCMMMEKKVFSKKAFNKGAEKNYVLVIIDTPNSDPELKTKNQKVMQEWKVRGVPTVVLTDAEGKEYHRFSAAQHADVDKFLAYLQKAAETKGMD